MPDLSRVRKQIFDDGGLLGSLLDIEQSLVRHPAVGHGLVPALRVLALAYYNVESVILQVERLARALNAVTDYRDGLVLEGFERFAQGVLFACHDVLFDAAEIDLCHSFLFL